MGRFKPEKFDDDSALAHATNLVYNPHDGKSTAETQVYPDAKHRQLGVGVQVEKTAESLRMVLQVTGRLVEWRRIVTQFLIAAVVSSLFAIFLSILSFTLILGMLLGYA